MNILFADDQSKDAREAGRLLSRLRPESGSNLLLVYVNELANWPDFKPSGRALGMLQEIETLRRETTERARAYLKRMEPSFSSQGLTTRSEVLEGLPDQKILETIEREKIDLVLLGTRGHTALKRYLLGSVSEKVVTHARASVLIARRPSGRGGARGKGALRLLWCLDPSAESFATIEFLQRFRLPPETRFTVVHVMDTRQHVANLREASRSGTRDLREQVVDAARRTGQRLLEEATSRLGPRAVKVKQVLATGDPVDEILKAADRTRADLIVVGARGLTGWKRFLLGSVSARIVRHAPCAVLVVRTSAD